MTKFLFAFLCLLSVESFAQKDSLYAESKAYQDQLNIEYADRSISPLTKKGFRKFKGLDLYPVNLKFRVTAEVRRTPDSEPFKMPTTTARVSINQKYADLVFQIDGEEYSLEVYQDHALMETEEYADYLFLPFSDLTSGDGSYGGGRYIGLRIPDGDTIEIDFNKAYNPYCAYNPAYSCPIVPRVNRLMTRIEAGVKDYQKP